MVTIEPIKNQYLTALKERQQIIDKINEIIRDLNNLNFNDLVNLNNKIEEIKTEVAQIEGELISYDSRLTTNENTITDLSNHFNSFETETKNTLNNKVNKSGDTMTGNLVIPTTTTGVRDNLAVNGERLQNDLDNYSQMVRTSGNQLISGNKLFTDLLSSSRNFDVTVIPSSLINLPYVINQVDKNGVQIFNIWCQQLTNGKINVYLGIRNLDGSQKNVLLGASE